ncbi:DUF7692 domain-containing protein [Haloarchaeobius sp. TZWSO28]|uniref:DUF7692 domain-containing protein n=1 Tax=Haloarchaeobius sp. TZWSO28 TaxID=3446119 RepID=UPI003EBD1A1A
MRIRTDGKYAYRLDPIEAAADFYDCNKTKAVVSSCEDVPAMHSAVTKLLGDDGLDFQARQRIAEVFSQASNRDYEFGSYHLVDKERIGGGGPVE